MNQRVALVLAAALTAFTLVTIGGIIARRAPAPAALAGAEPSTSVEPAAPTAPAGQALVAERESTYQHLVAVANARLEQANAELRKAHEREAQLQQAPAAAQARPAAAQAQPAAPQPAAIAAPAPAPVADVSATRAAAIARSIAPGATLTRGAELVDYQGTTAYEVVLDRGTVYVEAGSGKVLYDGTTPALVTSARAVGHDGGGHQAEGHDHEAEGHDHD